MKIRIDVSKRVAIAYVRDFCEDGCDCCEDCPADVICASLKERGINHFEDLENYELQAIINRIDGVERIRTKNAKP